MGYRVDSRLRGESFVQVLERVGGGDSETTLGHITEVTLRQY